MKVKRRKIGDGRYEVLVDGTVVGTIHRTTHPYGHAAWFAVVADASAFPAVSVEIRLRDAVKWLGRKAGARSEG